MKRELTRQQGIVLFILFTAGLVLITVLAMMSNNSGQAPDDTSGSSTGASSSQPRRSPSATPTPVAMQEDRSSSDSVRRDLVLTAAGFMTGVDPSVPVAQKIEILGNHLSAEASSQLTKQMSQYDWNKITAEQYLRLPDVSRLDIISQKTGSTVIQAHVNLIESKGGNSPTELPAEVWQFTLKDVNGAWQITNMEQIS